MEDIHLKGEIEQIKKEKEQAKDEEEEGQKERVDPGFRKSHGREPLRLAPGKKKVCLCTKLLRPVLKILIG